MTPGSFVGMDAPALHPSGCRAGAPRAVRHCAAIAAAVVGAGAAGVCADDDGQWPMVAKDYANTRYSGLDQITTDNVKNLRVAWTFDTGVARGQEAAPLVIGDTMYLVTPFPNYLYALKLESDPAKGYTQKWKYEPKPAAAAQGVACCDIVNRGPAFADGKVFYNTLDAHTVCVDAQSVIHPSAVRTVGTRTARSRRSVSVSLASSMQHSIAVPLSSPSPCAA